MMKTEVMRQDVAAGSGGVARMAVNLGQRFDELKIQAEDLEATKVYDDGSQSMGFNGYRLERARLLNWMVKVRHLIATACGTDSQHYEILLQSEKPEKYTTNYETFARVNAVLLAAKEDYDGGYLNSVRNLIQAELFESELEQATELLKSGYGIAAAVVAGVVLETTLRQLCLDKSITVGKLDKMNADLAKAGAYNKLVQKQVTAWADIRNSAAHGEAGEFKREDVVAMIRDVERFVAEYLPK